MRPSFWVFITLLGVAASTLWMIANGQVITETMANTGAMVVCTYFICSAIERLK